MRVFLLLIASCATVCAAGADDLRMVTACRTNESGSISTREIFTRGGQTNLVRITTTKDGAVQIQIHRFYHAGALVGDYVVRKDSSGFTTEAGCPYSVALEFWPSKEVRSVVFGTNGVAVDAFMATNGLFCPADTELLRKANAFGADVGTLLSPAHVRKSTPEGFGHEVQQFIRDHKDK